MGPHIHAIVFFSSSCRFCLSSNLGFSIYSILQYIETVESRLSVRHETMAHVVPSKPYEIMWGCTEVWTVHGWVVFKWNAKNSPPYIAENTTQMWTYIEISNRKDQGYVVRYAIIRFINYDIIRGLLYEDTSCSWPWNYRNTINAARKYDHADEFGRGGACSDSQSPTVR